MIIRVSFKSNDAAKQLKVFCCFVVLMLGDESAFEVYSRLVNPPLSLHIPGLCDEVEMKPGDVLEIEGMAQTGKTQLTMSLVAQALMAKRRVVVFDLDGQRFSVFRMNKLFQGLTTDLLNNLSLVRPGTFVQLIASIEALGDMKEHLVVIENVAAFDWQCRYRRQDDHWNLYKCLANSIKSMCQRMQCAVIVTKPVLFTSSSETLLGRSWNSLVSRRISLLLEDQLARHSLIHDDERIILAKYYESEEQSKLQLVKMYKYRLSPEINFQSIEEEQEQE
jgi:hypothetical protein